MVETMVVDRVRGALRAIVVPLAVGLGAWIVAALTVRLLGSSMSELAERWDGEWYAGIYRTGYRITDPTYEIQQNVNFFPGVSWTARLVDTVIGAPGALVVTGALWGTAAVVAVALAGERVGLGPLRSLTPLLLYPGFFYVFLFYSEGIAIAGSAAMFVALHRHWAVAGFGAGVVTGVARPLAALAAALMAVVMWWRDESDLRTAASSIAGVGTGAGLVVLAQHRAGDGLGFIRSQGAWGRELGYPLSSVVDWFKRVGAEDFRAGLVWNAAALVVALAVLVWMLVEARRGRWPWGLVVLTAVMVLVPASSGDIGAHIRYVLGAWPLFVFLGSRQVRPAVVAVLALPAVMVTVWWLSIWADGDRFLA